MINQFTKGINQDANHKNQPEGTYRFALNASLDTEDGDFGALSSIKGNLECVDLEGYNVIGHVLINSDESVLFLTKDDTSDRISLFNPNSCTLTTLVEADLGFSTSNPPVSALFRIRKGCERTIYFTDRTNPYRVINIDNLDQYLVDGVFTPSKLEFNPVLSVPTVNILEVNDNGGQLEVGSYQFAVRYLDQDLNPTKWLLITNPVNIYSVDINSGYDNVDGAISVPDNAEAEPGAVPNTTKSIDISFTNVDNNFNYIEIAALKNISSTGTVTEVDLLNRIAISNNTTVAFTYTGVDGQIDLSSSLDEIIVDQADIEIVGTHVQLDNTLWLGNLSEYTAEYATLQQAANDITVTFTSSPINAEDISAEGNSKNPLTPTYFAQLMPDEVYDIGIEYLYDTGKVTPVFHIPGRVATTSDLVPVPASNNTLHLDTQTSYARWKVENTATLTTDTDTLKEGRLGYYQSNSDYPNNTDCDGNRLFPLGKVRHHRIPDRRLIPTYSQPNQVWPIYLEFDNVTYPSDRIVGHRFVYSKRTSSTATVLDNAVAIRTRWGTVEGETGKTNKWEYLNWEGASAFGSLYEDDVLVLLSPHNLSTGFPLNGDHLKYNYKLNQSSLQGVSEEYDRDGGGDITFSFNLTKYRSAPTFLTSSELQRPILASVKVSPRSTQSPVFVGGANYRNDSHTNTLNFVETEEYLTGHREPKYVTVKQTIDPYPSLENVIYVPLHHNFRTLDDTTIVKGGDSTISELLVYDIHYVSNNQRSVHGQRTSDIWVDSTINASLFYGGENETARAPKGQVWAAYVQEKYLEETNAGEYTLRNPLPLEFYGHNKDYDKELDEEFNTTLPFSFNYCSNCINKYPYRIYFSQTAYQEELVDNYRSILANNYRDLEGSSGNLNKLFVDKYELYAATDRDVWFIPTRAQQIRTDESTAYIGTGDKLSIPPKKLTSVEYGYAGTKDINSFTNTEFGTAFTSSRTGKVFLLSNQLTELSRKGLSNFFENNLNIQLADLVYQESGLQYAYLNRPFHPNGVGIITAYDPRFQKLIIHKRDFTPRYNLEYFTAGTTNNTIYYDTPANGARFFFVKNGDIFSINLTDPEYFENKSFTISYSFKHEAWESFHSFLPTYMFNNHDTFYTTYSTSLWEHNAGPTQSYYDAKYDYIIDFVIPSPLRPKVFSALSVSSNFRVGDREVDDFFDRGVLYNSYQNSGLQAIARKTNPFLQSTPLVNTPATLFAEKVDSVWRLSNFRNQVDNYDVSHFTSNWDTIQDNYYIDKVPNPDAIDFDKSLFDTQRFRDEYLGVRLYYLPDKNNAELTLNAIYTKQKDSIR